MNKLLYILVLTYCNLNFAQVSKDTSYTVFSEFNKQLKKYPFIKIVQTTPNETITLKKDIAFHTVSNRNLHLDAYYKKSEKKLPAVILIHGGGWKSGNKLMLQSLAQEIAKNNYQCFAIEYRLLDEAIYPAAINDILNAIQFIKRNSAEYSIDLNNIALLGCSSGAQIVSLIGTKYPKGIQAVVNLDGILAFHHPQSQEGKLASQWLGGTFKEKPEVWEDASALTHVSKSTPPFLFINSQYERFHAGRDEMIAKMKSFNIDSKVETIENSPHTFWLFHPWFEKTANYIITFLDEKLKS